MKFLRKYISNKVKLQIKATYSQDMEKSLIRELSKYNYTNDYNYAVALLTTEINQSESDTNSVVVELSVKIKNIIPFVTYKEVKKYTKSLKGSILLILDVENGKIITEGLY